MSLKIVLAQFFTKNVSYGAFSKAINERYCNEKGYIYHLESESDKIRSGLEGRAPTWYKPKLMLEVFETHKPDYILFLDADAVVLNENHRIEEFIEEGFDIVVTSDYGPSRMNAGVLLVKNTEWAKDFLRQWWESGNVYPQYKNALWHDQTCFGFLLDSIPDTVSHVKIIEPNILNGRDQNPVCFIFHAFSFGLMKNRTIDTLYYSKFNIEVPELKDKTLEEIAIAHSSDKACLHHYVQEAYEDWLAPIRDTAKLITEVGVYTGNSLRMWKRYFPHARIIGIDNNPTIIANGVVDCELIMCDQSKVDELMAVKERIKDSDMIMDDGSHKMYDQQKTLAILFDALKPGGLFIIENLHTSIECKMPEKAWCGWGDFTKTTTLELFENYVKTKRMVSDLLTEEESAFLEANIESLKLYRISDESITSVIKKKL